VTNCDQLECLWGLVFEKETWSTIYSFKNRGNRCFSHVFEVFFLRMHAYLVLAPLLRLSVHVASSAVDDLISPNGQPPALLCLPSSWASSIATAGGAGSFQSHASSRHVWLQMDPHSNSFLWALSENSNVIQVQKKAPIWRGQPLASWNWMKLVNFLPGTSSLYSHVSKSGPASLIAPLQWLSWECPTRPGSFELVTTCIDVEDLNISEPWCHGSWNSWE